MSIDGAVAQYNENIGNVYNAREERRRFDRMLMGWDVRAHGGSATSGTGNGGVARHYGAATTGDLSVQQRIAGSNMSVDVLLGAAMVGGTENAHQGEYFVYNDATVNVVISAADPTNPRIDIVGVQVRDTEYSGGTDDARILVITGTPAGSPSEPTLPANFVTLARVDVAAAASSITNANITDRRRQVVAKGGVTPVASFADLPGNNWAGQTAFDYTNGRLYIRNLAGAWVCITPVGDSVATSETRTSATYGDLATPGPAVTLRTGTEAFVVLSAHSSGTTGGNPVHTGVAVTGASAIAANDVDCLYYHPYVGTAIHQSGWSGVLTGLTSGENTFTVKYKLLTASGTGTWRNRKIVVVGIP